MGSAPNVAATVTPDPHHPASQGLVQGLGPFIDTIVICTATAVMILLSGQFRPGSGVSGIQLTQVALESYLGPAGSIFIALAIFFFAFTSIVANYSYAENSIIKRSTLIWPVPPTRRKVRVSKNLSSLA